MEPEEFLILAEELSKKNKEAAYRSAISRAYYAAFHKAKNILISMQIPMRRDKEIHHQIYDYLLYCGNDDVSDAASQLDALRTGRNDADYELDNTDIIDPLKVIKLLMDAENIINVVNMNKSDASVKAMKAAIQDYIAKVDSGPQ